MPRKSGRENQARSGPSKPRKTRSAETLAGGQREISVSEFFAKNRHLLGFDNPRKALLTTVKEAVDNALDACEEAGILPDIEVAIEEITPPPSPSKSGRYRVTIADNGPGIVRRQVENIFGKLLYGSKFHRLKMSRGQQGIGISAAGMYGLMTTGKPMVIVTRPNKKKPVHHIELAMDTTKNRPEVTKDIETDEFIATSSGTGTRVTIELEARYARGKASVETYLEQTAIANPHAQITFFPPKRNGERVDDDEDKQPALPMAEGTDKAPEGTTPDEAIGPPAETVVLDDRVVYPRTIDELPPETVEIKPHPYGVELGTFLQMLRSTQEKQLSPFLKNEFSRVTPTVAKDVYAKASTKKQSISGQTWLKTIDSDAAERLYRALQDAKLRSPPTDCLSPIGVRQLLAGMLKGVRAEFYAASTRSPAVYRGNPFQIEATIAFGGDLPADAPARVIRFANRVPLLYQQSACCAFKSVLETGWKNYGLTQPRGAVPVGPLVVMIHMASVWVPFTSESKEAIADYDEIRKEMKLALQECGRKLGTYLRKRQKMRREGQRRDIFERYIGEIAKSCHALTGADTEELYDALMRQAKRRTEMADARLDEEGRVIDTGNGRLDSDDGVVIVDRDGPDQGPPGGSGKAQGGPGGNSGPGSGSRSGPSSRPGGDSGGRSAGTGRKRKTGKKAKTSRKAKEPTKKTAKKPVKKTAPKRAAKKGPGRTPKPRTHKKVGKPRVRVELQPGGLFG